MPGTAPPPPPPTGTHTLQLAQAQPSDSGMYTCEALNAAGRDQKQVQLSVLGTSCLSPLQYCPSVISQPCIPQAALPGKRLPMGPAGGAGHPVASAAVASWGGAGSGA